MDGLYFEAPGIGWTAQRYSASRFAAPADEPMTLATAKEWCRIPAALTDDDDQVTRCIQAAREYCEDFLGRRLVTQTWDISFDTFPYARYGINLPYGPLQSITSISYVDASGTTQTLSSSLYTVDPNSFVGRVYPAWSAIWPATRPIPNCVTVRQVVGYGAYTAVPYKITMAIGMLVANWFEHREAVLAGTISKEIEFGVDNLLSKERASWL